MFTFDGTEYKSKSTVALKLVNEGKSRMEISKLLGITYQTVHSVMKNAGIKANKVKAEKATKKLGGIKKSATKPATQAVDEAVAPSTAV